MLHASEAAPSPWLCFSYRRCAGEWNHSVNTEYQHNNILKKLCVPLSRGFAELGRGQIWNSEWKTQCKRLTTCFSFSSRFIRSYSLKASKHSNQTSVCGKTQVWNRYKMYTLPLPPFLSYLPDIEVSGLIRWLHFPPCLFLPLFSFTLNIKSQCANHTQFSHYRTEMAGSHQDPV